MQQKAEREYTVRFLSAMAVYAVTVIASSWLIQRIDQQNLIRYPIALFPLIPSFFALAAFLRYLRQMDELQRRIQFEAFGFSFGLTGMITFTSSLLERVGVPAIDIVWVFPMLIVFWGIGVAIATRRYC